MDGESKVNKFFWWIVDMPRLFKYDALHDSWMGPYWLFAVRATDWSLQERSSNRRHSQWWRGEKHVSGSSPPCSSIHHEAVLMASLNPSWEGWTRLIDRHSVCYLHYLNPQGVIGPNTVQWSPGSGKHGVAVEAVEADRDSDSGAGDGWCGNSLRCKPLYVPILLHVIRTSIYRPVMFWDLHLRKAGVQFVLSVFLPLYDDWLM